MPIESIYLATLKMRSRTHCKVLVRGNEMRTYGITAQVDGFGKRIPHPYDLIRILRENESLGDAARDYKHCKVIKETK